MQNYFELFDLTVSFEIDLDVLSQRYRQLQTQLHPDKFVCASEQERRLSIQHAAHVNDAYQTLKDSLKRAQYILELNDVEENNAAMDSSFLMEQMSLREELEGIVSSEDPEAALNSFMDEIALLQKDILGNLRVLFKEIKAQTMPDASAAVIKLQFINKLKEEAIALEDEIY